MLLGHQYVIDESDQYLFEYDTFELRAEGESSSSSSQEERRERAVKATPVETGYFTGLFNWMTSKSSSNQPNIYATPIANNNNAEVAKTPFSKLSSFKFRKELGRGAFGKVMLVQSKIDGQIFALKILSKKHMKQSDKRQLRAERDILHSMAEKSPHPFTTGLKFAFQSENNLYLGMDYFPGGNLKQLIQREGRLPEDWARLYAAELVLALSHLHYLNVIYRDIKPHNIMIDGEGHVILIDYGLSKQEVIHSPLLSFLPSFLPSFLMFPSLPLPSPFLLSLPTMFSGVRATGRAKFSRHPRLLGPRSP